MNDALDRISLDMGRRGMIGRIALLIGAAALPMDVLAAPKTPAKRYLAAAQFTLLSAIADTLVPVTDTPGALAARVPVKLDGLLTHWASAETRTALSGALARIDAFAQAETGKTFSVLPPEQRHAVLVKHDLAALKSVPRTDNLNGIAAMMAGPSVVDQGYARLKDLVVTLYYASEIGLTEELVYEHVPGKWVPSLTITPGMRPYASVGFI